MKQVFNLRSQKFMDKLGKIDKSLVKENKMLMNQEIEKQKYYLMNFFFFWEICFKGNLEKVRII